MKNKDLLKELKEKFDDIKKDLKFGSSFEEIDNIFFIQDYILSEGFVSEKLSRQICSRVIDLYMNWNGYLHSLIMPNPQNILNLNESKIFTSEERKEISKIMSKITELTSRNSLIGLTKNNSEEAKFIDDSVEFWKNILNPKLIEIMKKVNEAWGETK